MTSRRSHFFTLKEPRPIEKQFLPMKTEVKAEQSSSSKNSIASKEDWLISNDFRIELFLMDNEVHENCVFSEICKTST